jgi:glutamate N-acetyltransferase/amino-acid N-acetyltransferase
MELSRSPLAPAGFPDLRVPAGVRLVTGRAGEGYHGRDNLLLGVFEPATTVAGVLTTSKCPSAPVAWCAGHLDAGRARALIVNAGNANAFTGRRGADAVERIAQTIAAELGCPAGEVMAASTGVIGAPLDPDPIVAEIGALTAAPAVGLEAAAAAIGTTDTYPKGAGASVLVDGQPVAIAGIAKGSGMIAPEMATMLAFLFTDLAVSAPVLRSILREKVAGSFNAITVDGDTSTSDTCLVFATGQAAPAPLSSLDDPRAGVFAEAVGKVLFDLAMQVVRDGEGASKFVTVAVTGAETDRSAEIVAKSIANSPLVKTAIAGEDANWGRIVMAVGKAGEAADRDRLSIRFGDIVVAADGARAPGYREAEGAAYMKNAELSIGVDLGVGKGSYTAYTCDLGHGYVAINADYRS